MQSRQVAVDDAQAYELATAEHGPRDVVVLIAGGLSTEAYLGDSNVTASDGFRLPPNDTPVRVRVREDDGLYATCASAESTTVHVLEA